MYMYILLDTSGFVNTWMYSHLHFRQLLNGTLSRWRLEKSWLATGVSAATPAGPPQDSNRGLVCVRRYGETDQTVCSLRALTLDKDFEALVA